jgi:menaquinone-dependent protoporphyrinogen oxidase
MSTKSVSRRDFLKIGCLTTAATGLAAFGIGAAVPDIDQTPIDMPTFAYEEGTIANRVLVVYASATGSTVEVAATIGEAISAHGISTNVKPIQENPPIEDYQAVLIGSAVQYGKWLPEAVDFIKKNQQALRGIPVALFCVHITNLGNDETSRQNRLAFMHEVRPLVQAVDEGYFAGRFNRRGAALLLPGLLARFVPTIDLRNWKKIRAWADGVYPKLFQQTY